MGFWILYLYVACLLLLHNYYSPALPSCGKQWCCQRECVERFASADLPEEGGSDQSDVRAGVEYKLVSPLAGEERVPIRDRRLLFDCSDLRPNSVVDRIALAA